MHQISAVAKKKHGMAVAGSRSGYSSPTNMEAAAGKKPKADKNLMRLSSKRHKETNYDEGKEQFKTSISSRGSIWGPLG